jgi:ribose 5-phosphate isomerase A
MSQDKLKELVAEKAASLIKDEMVLGVGSGSTVNCFIKALESKKGMIEAVVAASLESEKKLKSLGFPVVDLNTVNGIDLYVDGADEVDPQYAMIKGGGGALTREKILSANAKEFVCIIDESKQVSRLGAFPVAVEVIPMARSYVGRELLKLGASPEYRHGYVTDNGNIILDAYELNLHEPQKQEETINNIAGVVCNGIFSKQRPNKVLVAEKSGQIKAIKC